MNSRAKALGHAIHPMLIVFPLGLLATAVVFDILWLVTGGSGFAVASAYTMAAGVVGGVVAGAFGLADWLAIPSRTRAKRVGLFHALGNVVVLTLFVLSWLLRFGANNGWRPTGPAMVLGFTAVVIAGVSAWLGGELVERLGVGVDDGANLNAPNSLSRRPVTGGDQRGRTHAA